MMHRMKTAPTIRLPNCKGFHPKYCFSKPHYSLPVRNSQSVISTNWNFPKLCLRVFQPPKRYYCITHAGSSNNTEELLQQGKISEALEKIAESIQGANTETKINLFHQQVDICLAYKKYDEGLEICQNILDFLTKTDAPMNLVAVFVLKMAELLHRTGKLEDAIIEYSSTIPLLEDTAHIEHAYRRLAYALSDLYKEKGNQDVLIMQQAIDYFNKSVEIWDREIPDPIQDSQQPVKPSKETPYASNTREFNKVDALYGRALCYIHLKQWKNAAVDLSRIIKFDPGFAPAYYYYGEVLRRRAAKSEEVLSDLLCKQGYCYLKISDIQKAEICFDTAIKMGKFHTDKAFHLKGKCFHQKGDWWKVVECNSEAIKVNPNLAAAFGDRGEAYVQLGLLEEAKEDQQRFKLLQRQSMWSPENW